MCAKLIYQLFSVHIFSKSIFYVSLLDTASLCAVMYIEVRPLTSGSPQTLCKQDSHWELLLLLFYVALWFETLSSVLEAYQWGACWGFGNE